MAEKGEKRDPKSHRTPGQIKRMNKEYDSQPKQIANRVANKQARAKYEEKHGDLPRTHDVDHITPHRSGGSNAMSNLRAMHQSRNRGWADGKR